MYNDLDISSGINNLKTFILYKAYWKSEGYSYNKKK